MKKVKCYSLLIDRTNTVGSYSDYGQVPAGFFENGLDDTIEMQFHGPAQEIFPYGKSPDIKRKFYINEDNMVFETSDMMIKKAQERLKNEKYIVSAEVFCFAINKNSPDLF